MKYRVKFPCYWYNTGAADNHSYINYEDFDKLEEAEKFAKRVNKQYELGYGSSFDSKNFKELQKWNDSKNFKELQKWNDSKNFKELQKWNDSENFIEVENGFIMGEAVIVKHFPATEEKL